MDAGTTELLLGLLGFVLGAGTALAWRVSERQLHGGGDLASSELSVVPSDVAKVLAVLRSSTVVLDENDVVLQVSASAYALGLVREGALRVPEVAELVRQVRRDGEIRQADLTVDRGAAPTAYVHVRVAPLNSRLVLVLADDRTREQRVDEIRRDFVANVSHELKTPVGAMTLLSEAIEEAAGDPTAVSRFAARMRTESKRLNYLVQQVIELSRLQGDEAVPHPTTVDVDEIIARAIDVGAIEAGARDVVVVHDGQHGHRVRGSADQVSLALTNLLSNAVAYSPPGSRVVIAVQPHESMLDISVSDQGIGIPAIDLNRIFERFYRVDPARHRSTGGTGLGLSIVKHVAASHGGEVVVWSEVGKGSSFTLRLPRSLATPIRTPVSRAAPATATARKEPA
jgi:two-component system sensor histidine kinase SenX3